MTVRIRRGLPSEAAALSALCLRSKAHWGYDPDFIARCETSLRVEPDACARGDVLVATHTARDVGVAALRMPSAEAAAELDLLFVEPDTIGSGVGAALFRAVVERFRACGVAAFEIASDPHAAAFYDRMGARQIGERPSHAMPERMLPLYRFDIPT